MYSNKENVNILTSLLLAHGVERAVVCPGSRNAPLVHNFHAAGLALYPVTDERSAGFYALGLALATAQPVVVCVTSGTALLNLAPAVAEASFRHVPLVVISADRPSERIGQLDAQTMPQPAALGCFVDESLSLPEPHDAASRTLCNRLVNQALLSLRRPDARPVHINVPISEPLFQFTTPRLPDARVIALQQTAPAVGPALCANFLRARRPMIVMGQMPCRPALSAIVRRVACHCTVLAEPLSVDCCLPFDDVLPQAQTDEAYRPDLVLYLGGSLVSKRLKAFLAEADGAEVWAVSTDGIHDTFRRQTLVIDADAEAVLAALADAAESSPSPLPPTAVEFRSRWENLLNRNTAPCQLPYSEELAVKTLENLLSDSDAPCHVHYANSTAVRLGCRHARHYIHVNRGVNGIEGSLSTAAGFSLAKAERTFCVVGDLSFFYDSNALWNTLIDGRLRILLLNNGGGSIFRSLPGLEQSPASHRYVMAHHSTSAQGICQAYRVNYLCATNPEQLAAGLQRLVHDEAERPVLLEAFF